MRLLNQTEKTLCDRILAGSGANNYIGNIIDRELVNTCILVSHTPMSASLEFTINNATPTKAETDWIISKTEEISLLVLHVVSLIKMLEKDGYILLLERGTNSRAAQKFGRCVGNLPSVGYSFNDPNVISLLCDYTNKEIYTTEEFKRFCENGYVPRDEQRFRRQILFTQIALGVALVAFLFNIWSNLKDKPEQEVKIDKVQYEELLKSMHPPVEINRALPPSAVLQPQPVSPATIKAHGSTK
ncbi:hypothetical protein ACLI1A_12540 [Flavobacterium sp. RHBU_3]|uniref:hypothetical protein n=1 Tax=Flavobacterium sp. RHBU_3 TaxID=3391184 RepID=UPI0039852C28